MGQGSPHAAHEFFDPRDEGEESERRDAAPDGLLEEEVREVVGVGGLEVAGEHPREFVAEGGGEEPNAHHEAEEALGGELRHRRETDRAEQHLAARLEEEQRYEPHRPDLTLGGEFRRGHHECEGQGDAQ